MKNRGIILALLLAGLVLLAPMMAAAHLGLAGVCDNCHIMHASQNGVATTPYNNLLKEFTCIGCHAYSTNGPSGRALDTIAAPQVHDSATPLAGGYFSAPAGADAIQHNVYDLGLDPDSAFTNIPGSGAPYNAGAQINCESCHDLGIGHQIADSPRLGTSTSSYRMLGRGGSFYVKGTGAADFEAGAGQNSYDADSINLFCASCHGLFHGLNQGVGEDPVPNVWLRHPTDVSLSKEIPASTFTGSKTVPLGNSGTDTDMVICLSCHRPHGSPYPDVLRFDYLAVEAGDATAATGCEDCHDVK